MYFVALTGSLALMKGVSSRKPFLVLLEVSVPANAVLGNYGYLIFMWQIFQTIQRAHVHLIKCRHSFWALTPSDTHLLFGSMTMLSELLLFITLALVAHAHLQGLPGVPFYCLVEAGCCSHLMKMTIPKTWVTPTSVAIFATCPYT